jgi:hypothetical protein
MPKRRNPLIFPEFRLSKKRKVLYKEVLGMRNRAKVESISFSLALVGAFTAVLFSWNFLHAQADGALFIRPIQVLNGSSDQVFQHVYDGSGGYQLAWRCASLGGIPSFRIGDVDNDGQREIAVGTYYVKRVEKIGKKAVNEYYDYKLSVFEEGSLCDGGPSWAIDPLPLGEVMNDILTDMMIADVDNDSLPGAPDNELVLVKCSQVHIYHLNPSHEIVTCSRLVEYPYTVTLNNIDVGDADNDGKNEIVIHPQALVIIWKYDNQTGIWSSKTADPVPSQYYEGTTPYISFAKVREADNLGDSEIIAAGYGNRMIAWKYGNGVYKLEYVSQDLVGNGALAIDTGDFEGDGSNEVMVSILQVNRRNPPKFCVFVHDSQAGTYVLKRCFNTSYTWVRDLVTGDLDGDGREEIAIESAGPSEGLKILDFVGTDLMTGSFQQAYYASGLWTEKVEVR